VGDSYPSAGIVERYVSDVLAGEIPACKWVRLACKRHVQDLETGHERGLWFDRGAAQIVIDFFGLLKHSKGEWAGQTIHLEPWQQFLLWSVFGWKREDGTRRFRTVYLEVARKNGKSTMAAGVGLYLLVADGEPGAEIYTAATKRDQAKITHSEATRMAKASASLRRRLTLFKDNIHIQDTASKFYNSLDGLNVQAAIVDEVHAHKDRGLWDVLETATGARRQPLMFAITTAGHDRHSLCYQLHDYGERVLSEIVDDDSFFTAIYTVDEGDDWEDERNWIKANPNLGVSKKWDDIKRLAARAKEMPGQLNAFLRLHLDVWTQSVVRWMNMDHWKACGQAVDAAGLRGRRCYGGLDLSSNTDTTSFVLVFPPEVDGDLYQVLVRVFVPEDNMRERVKRDRVPYDVWIRQGHMMATPGNVVDQDFIMAQVEEDAQDYDLEEVAFDRWGSHKIVQELGEKGLTVVQMGQGVASMSPPMKELETLVMGHGLAHGGHPVLTWMADNLVAREDAAGNIKPDKQKSRERIDGMVSLIMALDRATRHETRRSVYEERGVITL